MMMTLIILLSLSVNAEAACAINSISAVNFGTYDVFSTTANINGIGVISIRCQGGASSALVTLSAGLSNSYVVRSMRSAGSTLNYNLYTSAARMMVWGDGTGGSGTLSVVKNSNATLSIFGLIPAGQDISVGKYTDNIITTINF